MLSIVARNTQYGYKVMGFKIYKNLDNPYHSDYRDSLSCVSSLLFTKPHSELPSPPNKSWSLSVTTKEI